MHDAVILYRNYLRLSGEELQCHREMISYQELSPPERRRADAKGLLEVSDGIISA